MGKLNTSSYEDENNNNNNNNNTIINDNNTMMMMKPYTPPSWASHLHPIPKHYFSLAHLPTPIHRWNLPNLPKNTQVWLKREDLSGMQLSGNKVRKLEFLMADAVKHNADCVITIGGIQSNHCRATAVAAKYLNLDCFLILHTSEVDKDPGLNGNLLVERLVGAHIDLVSHEEFSEIGFVTLCNILKEKLIGEGRRPYVIPLGGSNSIGIWGDIEAIREIQQQVPAESGMAFDDIVVALGSGSTTVGLALGSSLSNLKAKVHAFSICDDSDYTDMFTKGFKDALKVGVNLHDMIRIVDAQGLGYAMSTTEELKFVAEVAEATGVVLDPVYSGKACHGLMKDMTKNPKMWEGRKVLFVHTGGLLGMFAKVEKVAPLIGKWRQMDIPTYLRNNISNV